MAMLVFGVILMMRFVGDFLFCTCSIIEDTYVSLCICLSVCLIIQSCIRLFYIAFSFCFYCYLYFS